MNWEKRRIKLDLKGMVLCVEERGERKMEISESENESNNEIEICI